MQKSHPTKTSRYFLSNSPLTKEGLLPLYPNQIPREASIPRDGRQACHSHCSFKVIGRPRQRSECLPSPRRSWVAFLFLPVGSSTVLLPHFFLISFSQSRVFMCATLYPEPFPTRDRYNFPPVPAYNVRPFQLTPRRPFSALLFIVLLSI